MIDLRNIKLPCTVWLVSSSYNIRTVEVIHVMEDHAGRMKACLRMYDMRDRFEHQLFATSQDAYKYALERLDKTEAELVSKQQRIQSIRHCVLRRMKELNAGAEENETTREDND